MPHGRSTILAKFPGFAQFAWVCVFPLLLLFHGDGWLRSAETIYVDGQQDVSYVKDVQPFISKYCIECHGSVKPKAELNLARFDDDQSFQTDRKLWDNIVDMLTAREMPPKDHVQPPAKEVENALKSIGDIFARLDCGNSGSPTKVGRVTIRRLNRTEYNNTIRDLLGVQFRPADDFPADDVGYGFDNIGDVLNFSPLLAEKYLNAAELIVEEAIPLIDPPVRTKSPVGQIRPSSVASALDQSGFIALEEGGYIIRAKVYVDQDNGERARALLRLIYPETGELSESIEVEIQGTKENPTTIEMTTRIKKKGSYRIGVRFLNPVDIPSIQEDASRVKVASLISEMRDQGNLADTAIGRELRNEARKKSQQAVETLKEMGVKLRTLYVRSIDTDGPINPPPPVTPASFQRLMAHADGLAPRDAAREILTRFASKAFRRPARPSEIDPCLALFDLVAKEHERFEVCLRPAVMRVLVSPQFLFRAELDPEEVDPGETYSINEYELASRLSYFLWNSTPDDELLTLAAEGKLRANLQAQVQRMVMDSKSYSFIQDFSEQWLALRKLDLSSPDPQLFPLFTPELREAMVQESSLFFEAIVREDHSILDLLRADFTFVNGPLAKHYGIEGVLGAKFVRVKAPLHRGGILTQASILTLTSNATRTSPVKRGKFLLEQILNTPPPPPPDNVSALEEQKTLNGTLRQVMEQHRANIACASCHAKMDPLGFAFENFDAIGRWRDNDGDQVVDASGVLPSGQIFSGPEGLKEVMLDRKDLFVRCITEKMLTYALGRGLEYYDKCSVDTIVEALAPNDYKFSSLLIEIIKSDPFQKRTAAARD